MNVNLWVFFGLLSGVATLAGAGEPLRMAEPDPPLFFGSEYPVLLQSEPGASITAAPAAEWIYHRTADGQHPDGDEQALVWLMNRARQDPAAEGRWLATESNADVASGRVFFRVNTALLQSEFASYAAKPPAAFDARLYQAAKMHSDDLIARDAQDHNQQAERIDAAGFNCYEGSLNVFSYARSALNAHAAFNIDWGPGDGTGMQPGRGHRLAVMAIDGDCANVGLAAVAETNPATDVGPLVVTGNYCRAAENGVDHFNVFLVGTVWQDKNKNSRYDPGEGYGGVMVTPSQGTYYAMTAAGGGYAIPVTTSGALTIRFSGGGVPNASHSVTVNGSSVLLDYQTDAAGPGSTPSASKLSAISTRGYVGTGENRMVAGFIVSGNAPKKVLIMAKGPVLSSVGGVSGVLSNPTLELLAGPQRIAFNDNWGSAANAAEIQATGRMDSRYSQQESAILTTLDPGIYGAVVSGVSDTTGNAIVEVYEMDSNTDSRLFAISTRGYVGTGENRMVAGVIISGNAPKKVLIMAKGPVLSSVGGVSGVLSNPTLELLAGPQRIAFNDNWGSAANVVEIQVTGQMDSRYSQQESAILTTLDPGVYGAVVSGVSDTTGNAIVEVYEIK